MPIIKNGGLTLDLPKKFAGPDNSDEAFAAAKPGSVVQRYRFGKTMRRTLVMPEAGGNPNLVFLPEFGEIDGGTVFTDRSPSAHEIAVFGNTQADDALVLDSDLSLLLDGSGDYAEIPASPDFDLGTNDFTIEGLASYGATTATHDGFIGVWHPATAALQQWELTYTGGQLRLRWKTDASGTNTLSTAGLPARTVGELVHWAVTREGKELRIFWGGELLGSKTLTDTGGGLGSNFFLDGTGQPLRLGYTFAYHNGGLSNVRIHNGEALYTENFTPPVADFSV